MVDRTVVSHERRQRLVNGISLLSFVGLIIWTDPSQGGLSFAIFGILLGFDVKERFLFQLKHFQSGFSRNAIRRLSWNTIQTQIKLRFHDYATIVSLLENEKSDALLESKNLNLLVINGRFMVGWHGGKYPMAMRGDGPNPGPSLFMFFLIDMSNDSASNINELFSTVYARTRLPIPIQLTKMYCEAQLQDFCNTLDQLGIIDY